MCTTNSYAYESTYQQRFESHSLSLSCILGNKFKKTCALIPKPLAHDKKPLYVVTDLRIVTIKKTKIQGRRTLLYAGSNPDGCILYNYLPIMKLLCFALIATANFTQHVRNHCVLNAVFVTGVEISHVFIMT
jgi:hypothetical protein